MSGCIQLLKIEVLQYTIMTRAIENSPEDYLILCTRQTHAAWCDSIEISYLNKALRFRSFPGSRDTRTTIPLFHTHTSSDVHVMWWWWSCWPLTVTCVRCRLPTDKILFPFNFLGNCRIVLNVSFVCLYLRTSYALHTTQTACSLT